jgi:hypothetical protein
MKKKNPLKRIACFFFLFKAKDIFLVYYNKQKDKKKTFSLQL